MTRLPRSLFVAFLAIGAFAAFGVAERMPESAHRGIEALRAVGPVARWAELTWGWWLAIALALSCLAIGDRVARWLRLGHCDLSPAATVAILFGLGSAALRLALLGLAWAGMMGPTSALLALVLGLALCARIVMREEFERLARWPRHRGSAWLIAAVGACALPYVLQTLLPNADWDSALHHLPMADRLLAGQVTETDAAFAPWSWPASAHLPYAAFIALRAESAVVPWAFLHSLGLVLAVYALAERGWGRTAGWWAAACCASVNLVWELGLDARVDGQLAFDVTLGVLALIVWFEDRTHPAALLVAATAFGAAAGTKYTGVVFAGLGAAIVVVIVVRDRLTGRSLRPATILGALALLVVPAAPWYVRNAAQLGDPMYPLLGGTSYQRIDGALSSLNEAPPVTEEAANPLARRWLARMDGWLPNGLPGRKHALDPLDLLRNPRAHARGKPGHAISPFLFLVVFLPLVARDRATGVLLAVAVPSYLVLGWESALLRHLLPAWPLLAAGAGTVLARTRPKALLRIAAVLLALQVVANAGSEWSKAPAGMEGMGPTVRHWAGWLAGRESRLQWLQRAGYNGTTAWPVVLTDLNTLDGRGGSRGAGGAVFMVGEGKAHLLARPSYPDYSWTGATWASLHARHGGQAMAIARELRERGFTHVLVNEDYILSTALAEKGVRAEAVSSLVGLRAFLKENARVVASWPGSDMYRALTGEAGGIALHRLDPAP